jgi:hypothetical protein
VCVPYTGTAGSVCIPGSRSCTWGFQCTAPGPSCEEMSHSGEGCGLHEQCISGCCDEGVCR